MSTMHMSYDDSAFYLHPHRDPAECDIAMALDMRPLGFAQQMSSDHLDGFIPASASFVDYDDAPAFALTYPILVSDHFVDLRHPAPRRHIPPELFFPPEPILQASSSAQQLNGYYAEPAGSLFSSESFTEPSLFAPMIEAPAQPPAMDEPPPPPPPPSWAMSGSLDPTTGVYQTAPEHPRVRTQQACEKCRGRKAKCSGERPCQRCVTRGLHCEYAPERKMRGPNKVRRNRAGASSDRSARRASVASSVATTSSEEEVHSSPTLPPFTIEPQQFTMKFDVPATAADRDVPSASSSASGSPRSDHMPIPPVRAEKARPPPINLEGTRLYDQVPLPLMRDVSAFAFDGASPNTARRASLPSHLLEAHVKRVSAAGIYSPSRGLDVIETTPRPRSSPAHPMELLDNGLSLIPTSHSTGSSSSPSSSTPITPLNMSMSDEVMYPLDFPPPGLVPSSGLTPEFGSFSHFEVPGAWLDHDVDATPTLVGDNKTLAMLEREFVHDI